MRMIGYYFWCVFVYAKEKTIKSVLYFQVKNWCFVTYRYFNFSRVPTLTNPLQTCAWKPVVIAASIGLVLHTCEQCNLHNVPSSRRPNYCAKILRVRFRLSFMVLGLFIVSLFIASSI